MGRSTRSLGVSQEEDAPPPSERSAREVMAVETREPDQSHELDLYFMKADLQDVVPHDNDEW